MEAILQFIKWCLIVVFGLAVLWAVVALTHWLPRPNAVERQSLAILAQPPTQATGQRNAFAAIWLLGYDIPAGEREQVAARDGARFAAASQAQRKGFVTSAQGRYPYDDLSELSNAALCVPVDDDCLGKIRTHADATRAALAAHALTLAQMQALGGFDHYRGGFRTADHELVAPIAGPAWLLESDAALRFVDGEQAEGLRRACAAAGTWRMLALHSDSFSQQIVASGQFITDAQLAAAMLAQMPVDAPAPAQCTQAFAVVPEPVHGACDAAKVAFAGFNAFLQDTATAPGMAQHLSTFSRWRIRALFNPQAATALAAPQFASYCTDDAGVNEQSSRLDHARSAWALGWQQAAFNPFGVVMAQSGNPRGWRPPAQMLARLRDVLRMATVMRAALAWRAHSMTPPQLGLPADVAYDAKADVLRIARDLPPANAPGTFVIPLPGSRTDVTQITH